MTDLYSRDCEVVADYPYLCGDVEDYELNSMEMCCACGGGYYAKQYEPEEVGGTIGGHRSWLMPGDGDRRFFA